jgi:hypothetical protein
MVVQTPAGSRSHRRQQRPVRAARGHALESWRLFEATKQVQWQRRKKVIDPVTQLERDDGYQDIGNIWARSSRSIA